MAIVHWSKESIRQWNPLRWVSILTFTLIMLYCPTELSAGDIIGRVLDDASAKPLRRVKVCALRHGRSIAVSTTSENDGSYVLSGLEPGAYSISIPAMNGYRPLSVPFLEISKRESTKLDLKLRRSIAIESDSWVQAYTSFGQSFQATGLALTAVTIKAFGPARHVNVQLLDGQGPAGQPVGPARITPRVGGEGSVSVAWSATETPTTPGQSYTLNMTAAANKTWIAALAGAGDVYPLGQAYFDGVPRRHSDLGVIICEDNDDLRTNYALAGHERMYRAISVGQEFIAISQNITFCSAMLEGIGQTPVYVRFSIHEGKLGGRQIGPSKSAEAVHDATVGWGPDEAPVQPGNKYYLHIESLSGNEFLASYQSTAYEKGRAAFNGKYNNKKDLIATVAGQITKQDFTKLNAHRRHIEFSGLSNPSFELGLEGWLRQGDNGSVVPCNEGIVPPWRTKMFGWTNRKTGEDATTLIYQRVDAKANHWYCFSGSVYTDHTGGRSSDVKIRLVALLDGQIQSEHMDSSQWYATEGRWRRGSVQFQAKANHIVVGFELEQRFALDVSSLYVDGALLEEIDGD